MEVSVKWFTFSLLVMVLLSTCAMAINKNENEWEQCRNRELAEDEELVNGGKVMLVGHSDTYVQDKQMQVTIAYNHFGESLIQRMPRCRHGHFHVVNNDYTHWEMYAIGGSADPTINSQGNRYLAPQNPFSKEVTQRVDAGDQWKGWNWRSEGDLLLNGAIFTASGVRTAASYARASSLGAKSSSLVGTLTSGAGVHNCHRGTMC